MVQLKKKLPALIFFLMAGYLVIGVWLKSRDLKKNGIILTGIITDVTTSAKSPVVNFKYEFVYNGKLYKDDSEAGVYKPISFIGLSFPVRFSPKTSRSKILITPRDFKTYDLKYPDSLTWVKEFLIKGI
jgi:hypothetical protein